MKKISLLIPFHERIRHFVFLYLAKKITPLKSVTVKNVEIQCLICHEHVNLFLFSMKSFFEVTGEIMPVVVIDDGSLTKSDYFLLQEKLPISILTIDQVLRKILPKLKKYSYIHKYFSDKRVSVKKFKLAFFFLSGKKNSILTEADILYFHPSPEINNWIHHPRHQNILLTWDDYLQAELVVNKDPDLIFRKLIIHTLKIPAQPIFNGGLFFRNSALSPAQLKLLNEAITLFYDIGYISNSYCDETIAMILTNVHFDISLSPELYKSVWSYPHYLTAKNPALLHYAGPTKELFEKDAIARTLRQFFHTYQ